MADLKNRKMGASELMVSPLGLGSWQFSRGNGMVGKYWPAITDDTVDAIVKATLEAGVNWFDTAEIYGNGESEKALAAALQRQSLAPGEVVIATKWWPFMRSARSLTGTINERLRMLAPYPIDLYQIHQPFSVSSIKEQMKAMAKLQKEGQIRYAGVSNFSAKQMKAAHRLLEDYGFSLVSNQVKYNLLDRRIEDNGILETAQELGMAIIAYSPLEQGILTGKFHEQPEKLRQISGMRRMQRSFREENVNHIRPLIVIMQEIAKKYGVTPSQVALNWLVSFHGETVFAIPGASNAKQAADNTGALHFTLTKDELTALDSTSHKVRNAVFA